MSSINLSNLILIFTTLFIAGCTSLKHEYIIKHDQTINSILDDGQPLPIRLTETFAIDTTLPSAPDCPLYSGIPQCNRNAIPIYQVMPRYVDSLFTQKKPNTVWIEAFVDTNGKVIKASVLKSNNNNLNKAVLRAMMQWKFLPCELNGKRIGSCVSVPFRSGQSSD